MLIRKVASLVFLMDCWWMNVPHLWLTYIQTHKNLSLSFSLSRIAPAIFPSDFFFPVCFFPVDWLRKCPTFSASLACTLSLSYLAHSLHFFKSEAKTGRKGQMHILSGNIDLNHSLKNQWSYDYRDCLVLVLCVLTCVSHTLDTSHMVDIWSDHWPGDWWTNNLPPEPQQPRHSLGNRCRNMQQSRYMHTKHTRYAIQIPKWQRRLVCVCWKQSCDTYLQTQRPSKHKPHLVYCYTFTIRTKHQHILQKWHIPKRNL